MNQDKLKKYITVESKEIPTHPEVKKTNAEITHEAKTKYIKTKYFLSNHDLGKILNISPSVISLWCRGKNMTSSSRAIIKILYDYPEIIEKMIQKQNESQTMSFL